MIGREGWPLVPGMARLSALPAFGAVFGLVLGRLDDVTGRRLGGIAGVLARRRQLGFQLAHLGAKPLALGTSCLDAWFCHDGKTLPNR